MGSFLETTKLCVCALCCQNVVCQTSSIRQHFQTKHEKFFEDDAGKIEFLKKTVSAFEKQSSIFKKVILSTNRTIEGSSKVAEVITKNGKPFTDGMFAKKAFLNFAKVMFDDLPSKCTLISRIRHMPISPRTVERRITDMVTDMTEQQTAALKGANVFSVALDESIDINDNPRLAVVARYCSNGGT